VRSASIEKLVGRHVAFRELPVSCSEAVEFERQN
jgi:hypothetical protein